MKKKIFLSLITLSSLYAQDVTLSSISVESTKITDVAQNAQTSADVANALSNSVESVDMIRRSGIANDILIRGQKRDNITVEVDGTKTYGACVNRMDPPVSHVVANQINTIEVIEGPYDVTSFGTLSGGVKITTKKPKKGMHASVDLGMGSWNYKKYAATISGGTETIKMLVTASKESSDQYRDGNGDTFAQQLDKFIQQNPTLKGTAYKNAYKDASAYEKKSAMAKAFVKTFENQELRLSVTANRSDNVLYPNSKMDADYDDSNIYSIVYNIDNITKNYKNINFEYYYSNVDHPMSTYYRVVSGPTSLKSITNHLQTAMHGAKLKNSFDFDGYKLLVGADMSKRVWDGMYYKTITQQPLSAGDSKSIRNAITENRALFTKLSKNIKAFTFTLGARYDHSSIRDDAHTANKYNSLGANIMTSYHFSKENKIFLGLGQAYRVPDARELYFISKTAKLVGTPTLNQTKNQEIDLGYETQTDLFDFKAKIFYSKLSDYIYIQKNIAINAFKNIDAHIYGGEMSGSLYLSDDISLDMGLSYKRGKKDAALFGQEGRNLADMAPLRAKAALNYEYMNNSLASLEMLSSRRWKNIDAENGEQIIAGWAVLNAKIKHTFNRHINLTLGVNNILNKNYAQNNTYADLTLITQGGTSDIMLMNEPGRYYYTNLNFKF
jgi:iron complex outermembrane receptor protein